jgi:hypothetical protein
MGQEQNHSTGRKGRSLGTNTVIETMKIFSRRCDICRGTTTCSRHWLVFEMCCVWTRELIMSQAAGSLDGQKGQKLGNEHRDRDDEVGAT